MDSPEPLFFASPAKFRAWLKMHASTAKELRVGFWKIDSGKPSMTWPESVEEALCFGWIDGVRKRIDDRSYQIRFTPRKSTSIWSAINIKKFEQLSAEGRMTEAGVRAFSFRTEGKSIVYAYEQPVEAELTSSEIRVFKTSGTAWMYFEGCPPGYRKVLLHWVTTAQKAETRAARLQKLIAASKDGKRLR